MSKKIFSLGLAVLMLFGVFTACSSNDTPASAAPSAEPAAEAPSAEPAGDAAAPSEAADTGSGEKWIIGLEYSASSCEFCQNFADATKEYGEAAGFEVVLTQGNRSTTNQMTNVEGMLAQGVQIVGGFWDDPNVCMPIMEACKEQDVWCIGVLCPLTDRGNGYEKYRFVGSENYNGGYLEGQSAAENLPENAKVLVLRGTESDEQDVERNRGFWAAMEEAGRDDVEVLDEQFAHNQREEGLKVAENWIQAYPDMQAIIAYSDETGCPAVEALKSADMIDKVQVYSFDGSQSGIEMVRDGYMVSNVLQDYKAQGYIDLCVSIRDTGDSEDMDVPFTAITPENAEEFLNY